MIRNHPSLPPRRRRAQGFLQIDLAVGVCILTLAIIPLGYSFARERQALRNEYRRSVLVELVDGEMEALLAGAGQPLPEGTQNYPVTSRALELVPPGHFQLTKSGHQLRLEWLPDGPNGVSAVRREATLK